MWFYKSFSPYSDCVGVVILKFTVIPFKPVIEWKPPYFYPLNCLIAFPTGVVMLSDWIVCERG